MNPKKGMSHALAKLKSIFWNLSQEHRITSEELDDFNSAMANLWSYMAEYDYMLEAAKSSNEILTSNTEKSAAREKKLSILCQVLGMHQRGIDRWIEYPIRFVTIINSQLRKANQPIYSENYFEMIDSRWRWLNSMIEQDMINVGLAIKMRDVYNSETSEHVKKQAKEIMITLAEDIGYLKADIKKGNTAESLKTKIINHWYDKLSTYNPAVSINNN